VWIKLVSDVASGCPRRAGGSTRLPELANVFAELQPRCCPVRLDAVAELGHVALEVELVLLQPRDVELAAGRSTLQLAVDVLVVVADDPAVVSGEYAGKDGMGLLGDDAGRA
jgi:hypothetical protein